MLNKDVAVLDFGSSKLTLLVGHHSVNNNFSVTAYSDMDYAGFMDGEFIEEDQLFDVVRQSMDEIYTTINQPLKKIYVGVPSEFCKVENKVISRNFGKSTRLNKKKIDQLFFDADKLIMSSSYSVVNIAPVKFVLDGTNETFDPNECYCKTIDANTCFVLADNRFISLVERILNDLGVKEVEFVSSILAEGRYILNDGLRNHGAMLVDVGYLTTTVAYFNGEGIVEMGCFSMGGAQITADLCEKLNISFSLAEQVKQKLLLTIKATGLDAYEVYKGNKIEKIPSLSANEIALGVIEEIVNEIGRTIDNFDEIPPEIHTIYLTGGGLSYLKGIEFIISKILNKKVEVLMPEPLKFQKPDLSSVIALLDVTLKMEQ